MNPPQGLQLVIHLSPNGQVQVAGPIDNQILCYGLLELGSDALKAHFEKLTQRSAIVPVKPMDPFLLKRTRDSNGG